VLAVCLLIGFGAACVAASMVWSGCAVLPIKSSRKPLTSNTLNDFTRIRPGITRTDLTNQFGAMTDYSPELRLGWYDVNQVIRKELEVLFLIPIDVTKRSNEADVVYLEFDEHDRVRRLTNATMTTRRLDAAVEWATAGRWSCVSATVNGERLKEDMLEQLGIIIKGDQWRVPRANPFLFGGGIHFSPNRKPLGFFLVEKEGKKRRLAEGVISIRGDTLEICYAVDRRWCPVTFESSPGSGNYWFVWRREHP